MRKWIKSGVCMMLTALSAFGLCACGEHEPGPGPGEDAPETNTYLAKGGESGYRIVLPESPAEKEAYAGNELRYYFREITGVTLDIVPDTGLAFSESGKYLSVGKTKLLAESGVVIDDKALNTEGFRVVTLGDTVLLAGAGKSGTLYAVYGFLERNLGYKFYTADEIELPHREEVRLRKFDVTEVPDFAHRNPYWKAVNDSVQVQGNYRADANLDAWGLFAHSYFQLLPPTVYMEEHRDWYTEDVNQLCLTAPGLAEELIEQLKKVILSKPEQRYFMVGQEDTNVFCDCVRCRESNLKYGKDATRNSATMMVFINKVARAIAEWQRTADESLGLKDRDIVIATFAYQQTLSAPAEPDETGAYAPTSPEVVAEDNVMVQIAPLDACYSHSIVAECNDSARAAVYGWQAVCKRFSVWTYSTNFTNYLLNFNNFSSIAENYKIFKGMGTTVFMDQGTGETIASPFHDLRAYLHSKLMWNVELPVGEVIEDFMRAYYKDVYPQIKEYFDLIRAHYAKMEDDYLAAGKGTLCTKVYNIYSPNLDLPVYWTKDFLDRCYALFEDAFRVIEKMPDSEIKQKLYTRVLGESLSTRYLLIEHQSGYYSPQELSEMIDRFEEDAAVCGLVCWKENTALGDKLSYWRNR